MPAIGVAAGKTRRSTNVDRRVFARPKVATESLPGAHMDFFPGFRRRRIETSGTSINLVTGGEGPPLLLLHGYPQTHVEWRKIAPELARRFTLVMPDLRGYGDSGKPPGGDNHVNYSKR